MIRAFLILMLVLVPVGANAQRNDSGMGFRLGQEMKDHREVGDEMKAQEMLLVTARCVAKKKPELARAYLAALPASDAETTAFAALNGRLNRCIPDMDLSHVGNMQSARGTRTLSFDHGSLRGALAEGLIREEQMLLEPAKISLGDDGMFVAERYFGERSPSIERVFALGFAGCVMGNNADAFASLMETAPASREERALIVGMSDSFGQCVMEGQTLSIDATTLRNQLAEVVYYANMTGANSDA